MIVTNQLASDTDALQRMSKFFEHSCHPCNLPLNTVPILPFVCDSSNA